MTFLAILQLLCVLSGVCSFTDEPPVSKNDYGKWYDARTSDGVKTYYRWNLDAEGTRSRERKGEMEIQCSFAEAVKILSNAQYTGQWMSGVEESRTISRPVKNEWYTYTVFSIPWPFNKRDLVSMNRITIDPVKEITFIDVMSRADYLPENPGLVRLTNYTASWRIIKINDRKIHITFTAESSTPPAFPRYIQDPVIEKMFHNNLVRLKNLLESKD